MKKIFFFVAFLLLMTTFGMSNSFARVIKQANSPVVISANFSLNAAAKFAVSTELSPIIKAYLMVKDALVADDQVKASQAAAALVTALGQLEKDSDNNKLAKAGKASLKSAVALQKATDIKSQRNAFKDLSEAMYQLLKDSDVSTTLYWDYCPMAKASWLSDKKEIANPYYGKSMLSCGSVKDSINP